MAMLHTQPHGMGWNEMECDKAGVERKEQRKEHTMPFGMH